MSNQSTTTNNGNKNDLNKDKILKEFSSKFISTISASSDDYKNGGSKKGWLLSEAIKQFE
uniref:Candidate secreted effector n=1 Tax=Meloidogyne incognita TaxID=6306 RepID=A0A914L1A3_MELIC